MTLDEIRSYVQGLSVEPSGDSIIRCGKINSAENNSADYSVYQGWDIVIANKCDKSWGEFNVELLRHVRENVAEPELEQAVSALQLEDSHWDWFKKSLVYKTDEYHWFYLLVDGEPQGACLIYHPKESAVDGQGIFYVEYVAVAPWNRPNPICPEKYKGCGTILIKCASAYACDVLRLRPGFCLHSLPRAEGFYLKIGMQSFPELDKEKLKYFEMVEAVAAAYSEAI